MCNALYISWRICGFGILVNPILVITVVFLVFSCDIPAETYQYIELLVLCTLFILFTDLFYLLINLMILQQ
jgi:hypothetical protein